MTIVSDDRRVSLIHEFLDPANGYVERLAAAIKAMPRPGGRRGNPVSLDFAMLVVIARLTDATASDRGHSFSFQTTIARKLHKGREAVVEADRAIEAAGLMVLIGKEGRASKYLMLPEVWANHVSDASRTRRPDVSDHVSDDVSDDVSDGMRDASDISRRGRGRERGKGARSDYERHRQAALDATHPPFPQMPPCPTHGTSWHHDDPCRICMMNKDGTQARQDAIAAWNQRQVALMQPVPDADPEPIADPADVPALAAAALAAIKAGKGDGEGLGRVSPRATMDALLAEHNATRRARKATG